MPQKDRTDPSRTNAADAKLAAQVKDWAQRPRNYPGDPPLSHKAVTNTDPGAFGRGMPPFTSEDEVRTEHQRLFGKGAKVSPLQGRVIDTPVNKAFNMRPRADDYGKDIALPAEKPLTKPKPLSARGLSKR